MGICHSGATSETKRSQKLDLRLAVDRDDASKMIKLLLLGPAESGKSTIFKQFRINYGKAHTDAEKKLFLAHMQRNTIQAMKILLSRPEADLRPTLLTERTLLNSITEYSPYDDKVGRAINALWYSDDGVRTAYQNHSRFSLSDSAPYLFEKSILIGTPNYLPTPEDMLRIRIQTTGIVEENYWVEHAPFHIIDVGGQRNERKKWVTSFENVTAVIFIVSLADYDLALDDNPMVNRLMDALGLFAEIVNSRWFENSCIILFLNKKDIFDAKIRSMIELRHAGDKNTPSRFEDYTGAQGDPYEALRYIKNRFMELAQRERPVHHHITCAVDTKAIKTVLKTCKDEIIKENLKHGGMDE